MRVSTPPRENTRSACACYERWRKHRLKLPSPWQNQYSVKKKSAAVSEGANPTPSRGRRTSRRPASHAPSSCRARRSSPSSAPISILSTSAWTSWPARAPSLSSVASLARCSSSSSQALSAARAVLSWVSRGPDVRRAAGGGGETTGHGDAGEYNSRGCCTSGRCVSPFLRVSFIEHFKRNGQSMRCLPSLLSAMPSFSCLRDAFEERGLSTQHSTTSVCLHNTLASRVR